MPNQALHYNPNTVNGRTADIAITTRGSDLYFAISAAMTVAGFIFLFLSMFKPRRDRIFHYITAAIVWVAAIAYFTMGSNLGFTPIGVEFMRGRSVVRGRYREIFYVRYIDWFITTPLLLLDLLLTAGMPWPKILFVIWVDWVMIIMGLIGALVKSSYKFGYFAIGCFALFYIIYELGWTARKQAAALGDDIGRAYLMCGCLTLVLWILYPIAWGLCEGGNYIAPDSEAIFYSVLDFFAKVGFGALLLWGHRNIDPARLGVAIRDYDEDPSLHRGLHGAESEERKTGGGGPSVSSNGTWVGGGGPGAGYANVPSDAPIASGTYAAPRDAAATGSYSRPSGAPSSGAPPSGPPPESVANATIPATTSVKQTAPQETPGNRNSATRSANIPSPGGGPAVINSPSNANRTLDATTNGNTNAKVDATRGASAVDTTASANAAVDGAATNRQASTPRTYAEAIKAASHGAIGGGQHAK